MANTISGNAGVSGATVTLSGAASASTTSAANGTYSFPGLAAGAYVVTPTLASTTFTPTHLNETIVVTDITNANFVAQATTFAPSPNLSDDFNRSNAVTLGPNWTTTTDISTSCAIVSHLAVPEIVSLEGENIYTGATFANDQFAAATIDLFAVSSFIDVAIRGDITSATGYFVSLSGDGAGNYTAQLHDAVSAGTLGVDATLSAPQPGDILKVQAVGTLVTAFYNGTPIISGTSATTTSGSPVIFLLGTAVQTDTSFSLFSAGPASFSISGSVGAAGAGATISLTGTSSGTTTAAGGTGNYSFTGLAAGTYHVTPGLSGKAFSPESRTVTITNGNVSGVNFVIFTPMKSTGSTVIIGSNFGPRIIT